MAKSAFSFLVACLFVLYIGFFTQCDARAVSISAPANYVFQFNQSGFEIENLAVRSNGNILYAVSVPSAQVWEVNPQIGQQSAKLIASNAQLSGRANAFSLTEVADDVFAVTAGNASVANTFLVHTINFTTPGAPAIKCAANISEALLLNGLATLSRKDSTILAPDSYQGLVYRINVLTGAYTTVLQDSSMLAGNGSAGVALGINGVRISHNNTLYYTTTNQQSIYKVPLKPDGTAAGPYTFVQDIGALTAIPDDFAISASGGTLYVAGSNQIVTVSLPGGKAEVLVGGMNSTAISGATSARFGRTARDRDTLYVSCNGKSRTPIRGSPYAVPGYIAAIQLKKPAR